MEEKVVTEQAAKSLRGRKDNTYRTKMPLKRRIAVHWENYLMMVPVVVFYLIFAYFPMYGIVFNLYNPAIYSVSDILDTYAYRIGIGQGLVERGAALGLFKTVINFVLLLTANFIVKKINGVGIYE